MGYTVSYYNKSDKGITLEQMHLYFVDKNLVDRYVDLLNSLPEELLYGKFGFDVVSDYTLTLNDIRINNINNVALNNMFWGDHALITRFISTLSVDELIPIVMDLKKDIEIVITDGEDVNKCIESSVLSWCECSSL